MKRKISLSLFWLLILIWPMMGNAQKQVKIGLCMANVYGDRWIKDKEYIPAEVEKLGGSLLFYEASNDHSRQFSQAKEAIDQGIEVLILIPVNAARAGEIVEYAHARNVKVISYDRLVLNSKVDYYISFDPLKVGRIEAEYALNKKPEGNYMILKGPEADYNAILFARGQREILEPHIKSGKIKIIYEKHLQEWGDMEAYMDLQDFIPSSKEKIDVILSTSDKSAEGAMVLLEDLVQNADYIITAQGASLSACHAILEGKLSMTVYKPVRELAVLVAAKAVQLARHEPVDMNNAQTIHNGAYDIPSFYIDPMVIDKNNMRKLIEDGFWMEDQLFKSFSQSDPK